MVKVGIKMKEKIVNFFKNHWKILTVIGCIIVLFFLGILSIYFIVAGCFVLSIVCFYYFAKFKAKYKKFKNDNDEKKDYFDARKFDYDEDIYYIGEGQKKTQIKKSWAQFSTLSPAVFFAIVGTMSFVIALSFLFRNFV